jgi:hypothetical protein
VPDASIGRPGQADEVEDLAHAGRGDVVAAGEPPQVIASPTAAVDRAGVEQRADLA